MSDVTRLLEAAQAGDRQAAADLLPLVYDELRRLAAARMANETPGHTLNPTALVHEAYLRLVGDQQFHGRGHFFAAAAEAMRRVLVDHARNRNRLKRAGGRHRVDLDNLTDLATATDNDLLGLDDALHRLAQEYPAAAELVKLRFFAGMTLTQAAETLGMADRTADRYWLFARTWHLAGRRPDPRIISSHFRVPWRFSRTNGALEGEPGPSEVLPCPTRTPA